MLTNTVLMLSKKNEPNCLTSYYISDEIDGSNGIILKGFRSVRKTLLGLLIQHSLYCFHFK